MRLRNPRIAHFGIAAGLALVLPGLAGGIWNLFIPAKAQDPIDVEARMRVAIPSVTLAVWGFQTMFNVFFPGLLSTYGTDRSSGRLDGAVRRNPRAVFKRNGKTAGKGIDR